MSITTEVSYTKFPILNARSLARYVPQRLRWQPGNSDALPKHNYTNDTQDSDPMCYRHMKTVNAF